MANYVYTIYTKQKWAMIQAIRYGRFSCCTMLATSCVGWYVQVEQQSGNCVDALDSILDQFPGSRYVVGEEEDKVIGGFTRRA